MTIDEQLGTLRRALDEATAITSPNFEDLNRRQRSHQRRAFGTAGLVATLVVALALGFGPIVTGPDVTDDAIAAGVEGGDESPIPASQPTPAAGPLLVLSDVPDGFALAQPDTIPGDLGDAFAGEEFTEVSVLLDQDADPLISHSGPVVASVRVSVGTFDEQLDEVFDGPGERVRIGDRDFDLVDVERETFVQLALVPRDRSQRTFLVTGRGVHPDELVAVAESVDLTARGLRVGRYPDDFVVIHSGRSEFASLTRGTAVTYRDTLNQRTITITTHDGAAISCFAYSWVYPTTELVPIGTDTGVVAQLSGAPGGVGTHRALWNIDHDTLVSVTISGMERIELFDLARDLVVVDGSPDAYERDIEFPL